MPLKALFRPHETGRARPPCASATHTVTAVISLAVAILCFAAMASDAQARKGAIARTNECTTSNRTNCAADEQPVSFEEEMARFKNRVSHRIFSSVQYPRQAKLRGEEGLSYVFFRINQAGRVSDLKIVRSSGSPLLDMAALQAVRLASPFPFVPAGMATLNNHFVLPVRFRI